MCMYTGTCKCRACMHVLGTGSSIFLSLFCRTSTTCIKHLKPVLESACMHAKPTRRRDTALGYTGFRYNEGTCGQVPLQAYHAGIAVKVKD